MRIQTKFRRRFTKLAILIASIAFTLLFFISLIINLRLYSLYAKRKLQSEAVNPFSDEIKKHIERPEEEANEQAEKVQPILKHSPNVENSRYSCVCLKKPRSLLKRTQLYVDIKNRHKNKIKFLSNASDLPFLPPPPKVRQMVVPKPTTHVAISHSKPKSGIGRQKYPPRVDMGECPPLYGKVTVLVLYNDNINTHYRVAQDSLNCYLKTTTYNLIPVHLDKDARMNAQCKEQRDLFFRKHCAVLAYLNETDWMYVMDADTGVVNPNHCLEEWIDDRVDIIFYERFWSFEIMAGNYIIKNSEFSRTFLRKWASWEFLPFPGDKLADNGVLHMVVLQTLMPNSVSELKACDSIYRNVKFANFTTYWSFVACVKGMLGANHLWPGKIRLYRKAHGWARDGMLTGDLWCENDFMFHSWKHQEIGKNWNSPFEKMFDLNECGQSYAGWHWRKEMKLSTEEIKKKLASYEQSLQQGFDKKSRIIPFLDAPGIAECYPYCEEDT